ncbi:fumarate hydratase [Shigella flexneri]
MTKRRWRAASTTPTPKRTSPFPNAALDTYKEVNTGTNLPAQIDLDSVDGDEYKFRCIAKGGGSANKRIFTTNQSAAHSGKLRIYLVEKTRPSAPRPARLPDRLCDWRNVRKAPQNRQAGLNQYYDGLPTEANEHGQAFRDVQLEIDRWPKRRIWDWARSLAARYFAHEIA